MSLTDHEKNELAQQFAMLAEVGEPEAMVAELRKACMRKANDSRTPPNEAMRWVTLAHALIEAEAAVNASPERMRQRAAQTPEWREETLQVAPKTPKTPTEPPAAA